MAEPIAPAPAEPIAPAPAEPIAPAPAEPIAPAEPVAPAAPATPEIAVKETLFESVSKELAAESAPKVENPAAAEPIAQVAPVEGDKKPDPAPAEPIAPAEPESIEYKFVSPEGFEIDDERKSEFTAALDAFRANPVEGAQGLIELHSKAVVEAVNKVRGDQIELFNNTLVDWEKQIMADPEVGGAGFETVKRAVARVRDAGVPEKDRPDFEHFLRATGAGSNPAFWRMMHNLAAYVDEPMASSIPSGIMPPKNIGKAPPGAKRQDGFYDHPRGNADS